jgi:transposase-like protein
MGRVRKKYPREFKLDAVKLLNSGEHSIADVGRRLGVSSGELIDWRKQVEAKQGDAFPGQGKRHGQANELSRLKRELAEAKEENVVLKKAMVYVARESK